MNKKKLYFAPDTEIVDVLLESSVLTSSANEQVGTEEIERG